MLTFHGFNFNINIMNLQSDRLVNLRLEFNTEWVSDGWRPRYKATFQCSHDYSDQYNRDVAELLQVCVRLTHMRDGLAWSAFSCLKAEMITFISQKPWFLFSSSCVSFQGLESWHAAPPAGQPPTQGLQEQYIGGCSWGPSCSVHGEGKLNESLTEEDLKVVECPLVCTVNDVGSSLWMCQPQLVQVWIRNRH